jgi:hypothetical protein
MVNLQQFLLSLLPVIGDRPAPVFLAPTFAAAVFDDGGIDDFLHAIYVTEERQRHENESQARPEIGGQRITDDWLRSLTDKDCLWRFWYANWWHSMTANKLFKMVDALEIPDTGNTDHFLYPAKPSQKHPNMLIM